MIRRSGMAILNSISKKLLSTPREPSVLLLQHENGQLLPSVTRNNEHKSYHSITSGVPSAYLPFYLHSQDHHVHKHGLSCHEKRCLSTEPDPKVEADVEEEQGTAAEEGGVKQVVRDPETDRTQIISVETSIRYLKSDAYKAAYGDTPVWVLYRRNFKGQFAPKKTRKTCIRKGMISCGNPCPICRDEYLVLDYRNVELLKQFISPFNGQVWGWDKTGLCRTKHFYLQLAITKAKDYGTITFDTKFREYNYEDYYPKDVCKALYPQSLVQ